MYKIIKRIKAFDMENGDHIAQYNAILNNPLCIIISETPQKSKAEEYGPEGNKIATEEKIYRVVSWTEKVLS